MGRPANIQKVKEEEATRSTEGTISPETVSVNLCHNEIVNYDYQLTVFDGKQKKTSILEWQVLTFVQIPPPVLYLKQS